MNIIEPKILKGTRDFLPTDMAKRNLVMNKFRRIFERFGYDQIETPIICPAETILGKCGEESNKLTYNFESKGGTKIALPYDLTVPFARLVAANWSQLPMPFKRYQIQRVWRAEKPQKGRLREFYQCDIDVIGTTSLISEAEVAKVVIAVFAELGFDNFVLKVNSRRVINSILKDFDVAGDDVMSVIRIIDKFDKIGEENVRTELEKAGVVRTKELLDLLKPGKTNAETLKKLPKFDMSEMEEFLGYCKDLSIPEKYLQFNPLLARGLDYYTGVTYEMIDLGSDFGSLCGGGRYDNLCGLFCKESFSGIGVSFGFERIMLAMEKMGKFEDVQTNSRVLVALFDENSDKAALKIYNDLLDAGINSEVYFEPAKLAKQFKYADRKGVPFVVIQGPEELEKNEIAVKNMKTGKQKNIPASQLISYINGYEES